jgi:hypothetical protein
MINNISWAGYWYVIAITLIIYYLFVLILFYRKEMQYLFEGNKGRSSKDSRYTVHHRDSISNETLSGMHDEEGLVSSVQMLKDETIAYLEQAGQDCSIKEEIVFSLQQIIKKYTVLKYTTYQKQINNLLQLECKNKCSLFLDEEDIKNVWLV